MPDFTINLIFAAIFGSLAWQSLPRGWRFLKLGWAAIQTNAEKPDRSTNIERQRQISSGTTFFMAGAGWLAAGLIGSGLTLLFIWFALTGVAFPFPANG